MVENPFEVQRALDDYEEPSPLLIDHLETLQSYCFLHTDVRTVGETVTG
jgi:hypothetical protein